MEPTSAPAQIVADTIGAAHGERSEARTNQRNGYRHRDFDTRAGTLDVAIPKLPSNVNDASDSMNDDDTGFRCSSEH